MLELKDICFNVRQDSKEKEILKNINLKIDERFVAITGPNVEASLHLQRL